MPAKLNLNPKTCLTCKKEFGRKTYSGRLEDATVFAKRKYCCLTCANSRESIKPGTYLWRARKHKGMSCEACSSQKKLAVHHCDQDQTNNDPENLQTLCKWCHDFWHSTAKRLGRTVAGRMPSLEPLMGWPIGHTDLKRLETAKSHCAPQPPGESSEAYK